MKLVTQLLQAEITAHSGLDLNQEPEHSRFQNHLSERLAQGYVTEDAHVIALMDCDSGCLPRLYDLNASAPRNDSAFLSLQDATPGIYPIVDRLDHLRLLMQAGARLIQLRMKSEEFTPEIDRQIQEAVRISQDFPKAQLMINDYWQSAVDHGAYGVHLGQEDVLTADLKSIQRAGLRLGLSSHCYWEVARAVTIAPSYVACGPIFPTRAKAMPWIAQGVDNLRYWVKKIPHPVVGIGGVNADNLNAIRLTGCASAAVIQAIVSDPNPAQAFIRLSNQWDAMGHGLSEEEPPIARPTLAPTIPF